MKRKGLISSLLLSFIFILALVSCSSNEGVYEGVKVTFDLNGGGKYKNSEEQIIYYYNIPENKECLVKNPNDFKGSSDKDIIPLGNFYIKEWLVADSEGKATDRVWNFETDKIKFGQEPITLIAHWVKNAKYAFDVYYKKDNTDVLLKSFSADAGMSINSFVDDIKKECTKQEITFLNSFKDEDGKLLDNSEIVIPEADEDTNVKVYLEYTPGIYTVVSTFKELKSALKNNAKIYLLNDIDCGGAKLPTGTNNQLSGVTIKGNNHKIMNFTFNYSYAKGSYGIRDYYLNEALEKVNTKVLSMGLFSKLTNCSFENVTFDNAILDIEYPSTGAVSESMYSTILIAPFTFDAITSTFSNVTVNLNYKASVLPSNIKLEDIIVSNNSCHNNSDSTFDNVKINTNYISE